jgi:hypothetical protein
MPSKKILVQEDFIHVGTGSNPSSGYLAIYPKSDNNFYKRTSAGVEEKLWDSGNHGAGSGLDADTLDGMHASEFAPMNHAHVGYVAKAGDTMTGNLSISKSGSPSTAHYHLSTTYAANYATQAWFEASSYSNGGYALIKAIHTDAGVPTEYNLISAGFPTVKTLYIGDTTFGAVLFRVPNGAVGNISHVLCSGTDGITYRVPVGDIGGGGGGTVTSVGLAAPSALFGVTNSPVTASGTISLNLNSQAQNSVFAGPTSGTGTPSFRALVAADIPVLNYMPNIICQEGRLFGRAAGVGAGQPYDVRLGAGLGWDVDGMLEVTAGGTGTVTSVGLAMPNIFSVTGSPVTTTGTLTATLASQSQRLFLASPATGSGVPVFRAIQGNDLPDLSASYDFYGSWNVKVGANTIKQILKTGSTQYSTMYNGISFIAGSNNVKLTESLVAGSLGITIGLSDIGRSSYVFLNQSPAPININTWTDIPTMTLGTFGNGKYFVSATIQMTKGTTTAGLVAARIIDAAGIVIASAEMYHTSITTNRMAFSLSGIFTCDEGPASVKLQIWANNTGWSAISTSGTSNSGKATTLSLIYLSNL